MKSVTKGNNGDPLQHDYNQCMDNGGTHDKYVFYNDLSDETAEKLRNNYESNHLRYLSYKLNHIRRSTRKFLEILSDGEWHVYDKLPQGIGVNTVNSCIDQGFAATKMVDRKRQGNLETYRTALRITRCGRTALQQK